MVATPLEPLGPQCTAGFGPKFLALHTEIPCAGRKKRFIAAYGSVVLLLQDEAKQLGPPAPYPAGDGAHWNSKPHTAPVCLGRFWGQRKLTPMLNMYTLFVCVCVCHLLAYMCCYLLWHHLKTFGFIMSFSVKIITPRPKSRF